MTEKRRVKFCIEYNGKQFKGWQTQPKERTVQGTIEEKLALVLQEKIRLNGSGRTDSGVHARGQIAHCDIPLSLDLDHLNSSLNSLLRPDIVIHSIKACASDFDSRFDAIGRSYKYYISEKPLALSRDFIHVTGRKLKLAQLNGYTKELLGKHDFTSFSKTNSDVEHYESIVRKADWCRKGNLIIFEIEAIRFLRGMVRAIVGTALHFEKHDKGTDEFKKVLQAKDRSLAKFHAPACGLVLEEVTYS